MDAISAAPPASQDALTLLRSDQRRIKRMFDELQQASQAELAAADSDGLIARIGARLRAQARLETEMLYPALEEGGAALTMARVQHDEIIIRLMKLAGSTGDSADKAEQIHTLADEVAALVDFEETEVFPLAANVDLDELGHRMALRRGELLGDLGED